LGDGPTKKYVTKRWLHWTSAST